MKIKILIRIAKIFLFTLAIIICSDCTKKEYVEVDVAPQLEITVNDISDNPVSGASVTLFETEGDFYQDENSVKASVTDATGKVIFHKLNEKIYYFYAEKGDLNNFYEVVTFTIPLSKNEIRTITCIIR